MGQKGAPSLVSGRTYLNPGQDDQMEVTGYKVCAWRDILTWFMYLLTVGLLRLLFYRLPHLMVKCTHSRCSLDRAEKVIMKDQFKQYFVATVQRGHSSSEMMRRSDSFDLEEGFSDQKYGKGTRWFMIKKIKYIWDPDLHNFLKLRGFEEGTKFSYFHKLRGYSVTEQSERRKLYGTNSIAVHVTPLVVLLVKEVLSPFYLSQRFSMILWYIDGYHTYSTCIFIISLVAIFITNWETSKFQRAIQNTIATSTIVSVCRGDNEYHDIHSEDLVPGDVIEIPRHGCLMQCDAVLVGGNCIVNESMLTGESVPITKTSIPNPMIGAGSRDTTSFSIQKHSRHVLFAGTQVIQTRFYGKEKVRAVVLRTGFTTSKGELVRSILYPKPADFKFHTSYFLLVLAFIACIGFIYTIYLMVEKFGDTVNDIIFRSLYLVTITVPPALPTALTMGIIFAQRRLRIHDIYCSSPRSINICGTINTVCFDKTGTLTEDGLNMQGVVPVSKRKFENEVRDVTYLNNHPLLEAMATCHSLTIIEGEVTGDPLDLIMFNATDWKLEEPGEEESRFDMIVPSIVRPRHRISGQHDSTDKLHQLQGDDIGVVRQFPFSSSLQRMSVITRKLGATHFDLYVKGSPEIITSLSVKESVPIDFQEVLTSYTQHGYRVIALAKKQLSAKLNYLNVQRLQREQVECDLTFLGLLVMENRLKPQSAPVIRKLLDANIRTIMVTGDNMLTALSVARECGMVRYMEKIILVQAYPPETSSARPLIEFYYADDRTKKVEEINKSLGSETYMIDEESKHFHFAMMGKTWAVIRQHEPELLVKLVVRGTVFARMSPDQKVQLIEALQQVGYYVGMCGDGANDCGALKAAHVGISLSEAEASVASPFTSKTPTIECVPIVIREGRGSLVTAFGIFKYMACYSLTQFISVLILYWIGANLTELQFLYVDLCLITTLFITFSRTAPCDELSKQGPPISLMSPAPIISIIIQTVLMTVPQVLAWLYVQQQPWFEPFVDNDEDNYMCHETSAVFLASSYQYIILSITFSKGAPFRKSMFTNWLFMINIIGAIAVNIGITIYPTDLVAAVFEFALFPSMDFRALFVGLATINAMVSLIVEMFIIDGISKTETRSESTQRCCNTGKYPYAAIESELKNNPSWPPVCRMPIDLAEVFQRLDSVQDEPSGRLRLDNLEVLLEGHDKEMELTERQASAPVTTRF